jgi:predicted short-subunit dehydrogenase-like oxidoreductase (DUF2520 family)
MKVVLLGAGNVSFHLSKKFQSKGIEVLQIFSRKLARAAEIANHCNAQAVDSYSLISRDANVYILAVRDSAIEEVAENLVNVGFTNHLIVHTSGATPCKVFENTGIRRFGVLYPLQTMSLSSNPDFERIPFCIFANHDTDLVFLRNLVIAMGSKVFQTTDDQRATLHLAAVIVNNFSNHLFSIGENILAQRHLPFEMLIPLIQETAAKLENGLPKKMQTGPAIRNDFMTIAMHLKALKAYPEEYKVIYEQMTKSIMKMHNKP